MNLKKQQLEQQIRSAREQLNAMEEAEQAPKAAALVGNCYKYRNCYSCPETDADYWWMYCRVDSADGSTVRMLTHQIDKYGAVTLKVDCTWPQMINDNPSYQRIDKDEYDDAFAKLEAAIARARGA